MSYIKHPSSYRDPSGFLYYHNNSLYRQVNKSYQEHFEQFISGALYQHLVNQQLLISHQQINVNYLDDTDWYQTIQPELVPFISYPYEWCFDMLKDAALTTLLVAQESMVYNMMLKDASAYNVQWHKGKMIFIDSLSFEKYDDTKPWIAYRQFCEHFLAPLALMHYRKWPLQNLWLAYPDGFPLPLTKKLLPYSSKWNLNVFLHLHMHASFAERNPQKPQTTQGFSSGKLKNIFKSLEAAVNGFELSKPSGIWSGYYDEALQRNDYITQKKQIIDNWVGQINVQTALDVGANEGEFSLLIAKKNIYTISADFDHYSINRLYQRIKNERIDNVLPLVIDLSHPSPAIGVNNEEREPFSRRMKTDLVMALAIIHHLVIGKNIPFETIARFFQNLGTYLLIEFIPKTDEKVQLMLQQKKDIYPGYTAENFLDCFSKLFSLIHQQPIGNSGRVLYLFKKHE